MLGIPKLPWTVKLGKIGKIEELLAGGCSKFLFLDSGEVILDILAN